MARRHRKRKTSAPSRFRVGDRVRVKHGVQDEEYPDIPLGGWAGAVVEWHRDGVYTVHWSRETLAAIHPIYKKRCERDGLVLQQYWIDEKDLEPDPGGPLSIEQPVEITPRPLSAKDQGDRVRMVFGLTSDDLLPRPDEGSLETYGDYLAEKLTFPFDVRFAEQPDDFFRDLPVRSGKVLCLDRETAWDEDEGILCEVRTAGGEEVVALAALKLARSDPNRRYVEDYRAWLVGDLVYDEEEEFEDEGSLACQEGRWSVLARSVLDILALGMIAGAVVGATVAVTPWARWGAAIGGTLLAALMAAANVAKPEHFPLVKPRFRKFAATFCGLSMGGIVGALFGVMAVAFVGTILGGLAGILLKRFVPGPRWPEFAFFPGEVMLPAALGVVIQSLYLDRDFALQGLAYGAAVGLAGGAMVTAVLFVFALSIVGKGNS